MIRIPSFFKKRKQAVKVFKTPVVVTETEEQILARYRSKKKGVKK